MSLKRNQGPNSECSIPKETILNHNQATGTVRVKGNTCLVMIMLPVKGRNDFSDRIQDPITPTCSLHYKWPGNDARKLHTRSYDT